MRSCAVCGSDTTAQAFVKDGVRYLDCAGCGARFAASGTNANFSTALVDYEGAYLQYLAAEPADERNHDELLAAVESLGGRLHTGPVLDVGCGSGKLVRHLRERGCDAFGVEPAEALFEHFLADDDGFFCDLPAARGALDAPPLVVLAIDVLEHVERPVEFLRELGATMAPDGLLIVSTPDRGSRTARLLGRRWHHYNRYHLALFSASTIRVAARQAGLEVEGIRRPGRYRQLSYVARYLFEFGLGRRAPAWVRRLDSMFVPVNLRDTMLVCLTARRH